MACDFFTAETIWLQTLYVLFFIHLNTRQVVVAGVTARPDSSWVTQQARNATMDLHDRQLSTRFLLRDHDAKFTGGFDEVFHTEGAKVIRTPIRAPRANAYAERWVQTVRVECLDWTLVVGRRHLVRLLRTYVRHYNEQRPSLGVGLGEYGFAGVFWQVRGLAWWRRWVRQVWCKHRRRWTYRAVEALSWVISSRLAARAAWSSWSRS